MVPDETSDLPTTLPEASFLNPNRKVPSEARSLRGLFPVPVFAEFPSYSLSKNADGFLQNPFWLSYCNLRKLKEKSTCARPADPLYYRSTFRRDVRVVDRAALEMPCPSPGPGFESRSLRQMRNDTRCGVIFAF